MLNDCPLIFVHIPKTAGTSFRVSLEQFFGLDQICMDYGVEYGGTSSCVLEWFQSRDFYEFYNEFKRKKYRVLSGHFGAAKYVNLFPVQSMVSFLRDPVKRVISEYRHFIRNHGYKGSVEEFYRWDRNINMQSKMLSHVPLQSIGLVGITERYEDSLVLFNHRFGVGLQNICENVDPRGLTGKNTVSKKQIEEIEFLNQGDISIYRLALEALDEQLDLLRSGNPYTYAQLQMEKSGFLAGWAFQRDNDKPIKLQFNLNGKEYRTLIAKDYRVLLHRFGCPRGGHLGFRFELPKLKKDDEFQCQVVDTGQWLTI